MPLILKLVFLSLLTLASVKIHEPKVNVRGLRIDIGYFYNLYPGLSVPEISALVVSKARASGVNTLFIYAYNPVFGATYETSYPFTSVEAGYGRLNILNYLAMEAKKFGIKVVASVPINNFKSLWEQKPAWRAKAQSGADYIPAENMYLLSAWHPEFRNWLTGFFKDLMTRNPHIAGIETVEPFIDYRWQKESDYNPVATNRFKRVYPKARLGDDNWLAFRAQGLTELIGIMNLTAHSYKKRTYLVHTWPVQANGKLYSSTTVRNLIGLDVEEILKLRGAQRLNYMGAELIWQQWAAEYESTLFNPDWTHGASIEFMELVKLRAIPLIHIEVTPFIGPKGNVVTPTDAELAQTLKVVRDLNVGMDIYDFSQLEYANQWDELLSWY